VWDIVIRGAVNGALFALIAVGINLQYGITKILNVAHGQFLMLGGFITCILFNIFRINPLVSLVLGGGVVAVVGVLIYMLVFRRIVYQSKSPEELEVRSLLACFGLIFVIQNALFFMVQRSGISGITSINFLRNMIEIFGVRIELVKIVAMVVAIILNLVLYAILRFTRMGIALRAVAQEPTGARLVGINISRYHLISFSLSAFLGAAAGSLLAMVYYTLSALQGGGFTFIALAVIVLGGVGSFIGSLVGGFIMGYAYYITLTTELALAMPVVYIILIVTLAIRPKGLFGR